MIITGSKVGMESKRMYTQVRREAYNSSVAHETGLLSGDFSDALKRGINTSDDESNDTDTSKSDDFGNSLKFLEERFDGFHMSRVNRTGYAEEDAISRIRTLCIKYLLMLLFGREAYDKYEPHINQDNANSNNSTYIYTIAKRQTNYSEYIYEGEATSFDAAGKVVTADGREIDFSIGLNMSRSFEAYYEEKGYSVDLSILKDPLVINLDCDNVTVSDQTFVFDLDADGENENVVNIGAGSGFLALDKNNDGIINDGTELFGASSGNGFLDLSEYDEDGNGFIDEADSVFQRLKIMSIGKNGEVTTYSLKDKGVGAIGLFNVLTDFSLKTNETTDARIRRTGIFLYENGTAGTIQQVDLKTELKA